jgi:adenylyltransferase/sulfurtransferase
MKKIIIFHIKGGNMLNRKSKINTERYDRQIALIGKDGQEKLKKACVMIVGAGGLGNIAAKFLASSGVGKLILIDHDKVEESNLNRQFLFNKKSINRPKAIALKETLYKINPEVKVEAIVKKLDFTSEIKIMEIAIAHNVSVILDCTDNMETAYLVEAIALNLQIPLVFGKTSKYSGIVTIIKDSFLKANYPTEQLNPEGSVFPCIGGIIGSIQASLALKLVLDLKIDDDILYYDVLNNEMIKYKKGE